MIMGPGLKYHASSESFGMLKNIGDGTMASGAPRFPIGVVDVRDVAAAHIAAAFLPEAKGRHIVCSSNTDMVEMGQTLAEKYPNSKYPIASSELMLPKAALWLMAPFMPPLTRAYVSKNIGYKMNFDSSKAENELGMKWYPLNETLGDMYQQMLDEGVVKPKS